MTDWLATPRAAPGSPAGSDAEPFAALSGPRGCGQERRDQTDLVACLQSGDPQAFEQVVVTHQHRVFGVALRMLRNRSDAEDVAQEVFLKAFRGIGSFRGTSTIGTWLYAITARVCLTRLKTQGRWRVSADKDVLEQLVDDKADTARDAEARERWLVAEEAIAALEPPFRAALILRDVEGLAYEEIAEALDLPLNTVKSRIHRARSSVVDALARRLG